MLRLIQDVRFSLRVLTKNPGFTAVAVLVLALGIGANTAVFSLVNALLLKPLPGRSGSEVVGIFSKDRTKPDTYRAFSYPDYEDVRARGDIFSDVMAHNFAMVGVNEGDNTRRAFAAVVSSNYFDTLGAPLATGRAFTPQEERPDSRIPVVVVGYEYWKKTNFDPDILSRSLKVNAQSFTIVGVTQEGFAGTMALVSPEAWFPLGMYEVLINDMFSDGPRLPVTDRNNDSLILVGRLKPGVSVESSGPMLASLSSQLEQAYPVENRNQTLIAHRLPRMSVSTAPSTDTPVAAMSALLMGMAGVVLLIACLNLANMMLARGAARRKEIAIRLALGGGRGRIIRQLLTEGLLLSLAGGVAGLLIAYWSIRLLIASLTPIMPMVLNFTPEPDIRVLGAALGFCVLSTLFFGLGPAWKLVKADALPELKDHAGDDSSRLGGRFSARNVMVVGQLALSLTLLVSGGLFIRAALKAATATPGFSMDRGVIVGVDPSLAGYDERHGRALYQTLLERLRSLPGVEGASMASIVPFGEFSQSRNVQKAGAPIEAGTPEAAVTLIDANYNIIAAGYFKALGLALVRGRDFTRDEEQSSGGLRVVIIDEPLAKQLFGAVDPLGQRLQFGKGKREPVEAMEVVGVAPGLRHDLFDREPVPHVYIPFGQQYRANMNIHVRLAAGGEEAESAMLGTIRKEVRSVDAQLPVVTLKSLRTHRDASLPVWAVNTGASLFTAFGMLALFLAVVGVYGVKAYVVSRRTREIGIRMALGASPQDVLRMVLREGIGLAAVGLGLGFVLALGAGRLLGSLLYDVSPHDPVIFVSAPLVLAAATLLACYLPARRATRVVPLTALRSE